VGVVQGIESNHREQGSAAKGSTVAVKIVNEKNPTLTFGRQFDAACPLYSRISRQSIDALKEHFKSDLGNDDWKLVIELKKVCESRSSDLESQLRRAAAQAHISCRPSLSLLADIRYPLMEKVQAQSRE
jgi:hypothetical protein